MTSTCFSVRAWPGKSRAGTLSTMRAFLHPICIVKSAMHTRLIEVALSLL